MDPGRTPSNGAYARPRSESLIRAAEDAEARFGAAAPWTLQCRDDAADKLAKERHVEQAKVYEEESLRRRLSMKRSAHALEDGATLNNRLRLARHYSETDNSADAIEQLRTVLSSLDKQASPDWGWIFETRNELTYELLIGNEPTFGNEVIDICTMTLNQAASNSIFEIDHQAMVTCRDHLAEALFQIGRFEDACRYYQENIEALESMDPTERASKQLDEILTDARDGLESCNMGVSNPYVQKEADGQQSEPTSKPDSVDLFPAGNTVDTVVEDQVDVDQHGEGDEEPFGKQVAEGKSMDAKDRMDESPGPLEGPSEGVQSLTQESEKEEKCAMVFDVASEQSVVEPELEGNGNTDSGEGSAATSSEEPHTPKEPCEIAIPSPNNHCSGDYQPQLGLQVPRHPEDRDNTNETVVFRVPGEWPREIEPVVNPLGGRRHTQSMDNIHSKASDKAWQNPLELQPSRPASVAVVERTVHYGPTTNDFVSSSAGELRSHDIGPHPSDKFFSNLKQDTHELLDKYKEGIEGFRPKPVRIAILDTGIARFPEESEPDDVRNASGQIKLGKILDRSLPPDQDEDGHGTHCAGILLKVCPYANIYVYRISNRRKGLLNPEIVADAIHHAVSVRKVDVISMSFGWKEDNSQRLRDAIEFAKQQKVLMFAAASNEGGDITFPARADEVIAIDAATQLGRALEFNPCATGLQPRFTALGDEVLSAWPIIPGSENMSGRKRESGTSAATAVAAATAALLLAFARQPPLCFEPEIEKRLKDLRGMRDVLLSAVCRKKEANSDFTHIDITALLHVIWISDDGGIWSEWWSPRGEAARQIVNSLCRTFGFDLKRRWKDAFNTYLREHPEEG